MDEKDKAPPYSEDEHEGMDDKAPAPPYSEDEHEGNNPKYGPSFIPPRGLIGEERWKDIRYQTKRSLAVDSAWYEERKEKEALIEEQIRIREAKFAREREELAVALAAAKRSRYLEEPTSRDRDEAVVPSRLLVNTVRSCGDPVPAHHRAFTPFCEPVEDNALRSDYIAHTERYISELLRCMGELPVSPGRGYITPEDVQNLKIAVKRVSESFTFAKDLIRIFRKMRIRCKGFDTTPPLSEMISKYISNNEEYTKYRALSQWVWRRNPEKQRRDKIYNVSPERKAKIASNRPSKEAEAERKRVAYYEKMGRPVPERKEPTE